MVGAVPFAQRATESSLRAPLRRGQKRSRQAHVEFKQAVSKEAAQGQGARSGSKLAGVIRRFRRFRRSLRSAPPPRT
eukprot:11507817-Alexandrium_andersonii.AAC.1